jgi:hypothetical protein
MPKDWVRLSEYAEGYVDNMAEVRNLSGRSYAETGADAVRGFLNNAQHWQGETARRVKAELRAMLKEHDAKSDTRFSNLGHAAPI